MKMPEQESVARSDVSLARPASALARGDDPPYPPAAEPPVAARPRARGWPWASAGVCACYLAAAFAVTWHLWAHPTSATVAGNPEDSAQFAWFMRYAAIAVTHGRLPALVTTAMNVPRGVNMMWNTSVLLPGVLLTPVTVLAGPQASLTVLLTLGFAGSAASLFYVLRPHGVSIPAAALGGAVYGFSPALTHSAMGHYQLQFAVLPPLIADAIVRLCLGSPRPVRSGAWLGLLVAAQLFIGEEMLFESVLAAAVLLVVLAVSGLLRGAFGPARLRWVPAVQGLATAVLVAAALSSWGLWTQFAGPLTQHGSPFATDGYRNSLAAFISPTSYQLLHAGPSSRYASGGSEALAYLGVTMIVVLLAAAVAFWRQLPVRACAVTAFVLLLLSVGAQPKIDHGTFSGVTLPWAWLEHLPVVGDLLPNRLSILGDAAAAALLAFAIDLTRARLGRTAIGKGWAAAVVATAAVIAAAPLIPRPLPGQPAVPLPAGWSATLSALRLPAGARVLVVPVPMPTLDDALRWQADTGARISLIGGYFEGPDSSGEAHITSHIVQPLSQYLDARWTGTGDRQALPPAEVSGTLRYWDPQAVVADAPPAGLLRYLEGLFGQPSVRYGSMVGWRLAGRPVHQVPAG
jgi:hypothetical protein